MRMEERGLQRAAALTVWWEAHCARDFAAPECEDSQRFFSGQYCVPELPEFGCMQPIAPYLDEVRALRTAASAP